MTAPGKHLLCHVESDRYFANPRCYRKAPRSRSETDTLRCHRIKGKQWGFTLSDKRKKRSLKGLDILNNNER